MQKEGFDALLCSQHPTLDTPTSPLFPLSITKDAGLTYTHTVHNVQLQTNHQPTAPHNDALDARLHAEEAVGVLQQAALHVNGWTLQHRHDLCEARFKLARHEQGLATLNMRDQLDVKVLLAIGRDYERNGSEIQLALQQAVLLLANLYSGGTKN